MDHSERRSSLDGEQTIADTDQAAADTDQTASDTDQRSSDLDVELARADQVASDRDQATADRADRAQEPPDAVQQARSRAERTQTTAARARTAVLRDGTRDQRLDAAASRDEAAVARDLVAATRDTAAVARDTLAAGHERLPPVAARARAASDRRRAADDRARAAEDRRLAAEDRERARVDRDDLHEELSAAQFDELTGAYRRGIGAIALQTEIDRARRGDGRLVLACLDVDDLKGHNDRAGHSSGDALLRDVVAITRANLRSYDPVVRMGGDEFLCALPGATLDDADVRFGLIAAAVALAYPGAGFSVGFAELTPQDTLEVLAARGDAALYAVKAARPRAA